MNQPDPTAALARIRQMTDYWEQHLPEVIRTPAVVSAIRAALELAGQPSAGPDPCSACRYVPCGNCVPAVQSPADWIDGHPQLEAIAAAVWEQCEHHDSGLITDDPRNIAVAALAAVLPEQVDRAAVRAETLREAESAFRQQASHLTGEFNDSDILHEDGPAATVATWKRAADLLRRLAGEQPTNSEGRPRRGDQFEAWLKAQRDEHGWQGSNDRRLYDAFDNALDRYRLHADTGTPLGEHVCEGRAVGNCECLERPEKRPPMDPVHILGIDAESTPPSV